MPSVEVAVSHPSLLGECPIWSQAEGLLYWIDIEGRQIHRFDPSTGIDEAKSVRDRPGSMVLTEESGLFLVAMEHELVWFRWATGEITSFVSLEERGNGNRLNDGRTDSAGRYVLGSMWADPLDGRSTGSLYSVEGDGSISVIRKNIGVSNGIAFDADRNLAYFADTFTKKIIRWDYDLSTAERTNERDFYNYAGRPGLPDGGCVDADGCYWSASVNGWAVIRVTPEGNVDRQIELPVKRPTMPAFGGPDLGTLFITSIGMNTRPGDNSGGAAVPPGSLLAIDTGTHGLAETPFASNPGVA